MIWQPNRLRDSFHLLLVEVLHPGQGFENEQLPRSPQLWWPHDTKDEAQQIRGYWVPVSMSRIRWPPIQVRRVTFRGCSS
ncbi:MAG: hypothetical protein H6Q43_3908, partial [Deltaproteobacteria bacterium]|nr:hypothetical protein [Deltaproteobacteria bacterium]